MNRVRKEVEELIAIEELCRILKLKKSYVYLLTHEKKIPHYKINGHLRFRVSDIENWLKEHYINAEQKIKIVEF